MAIFIDRRPKLNRTAIIICSVALILMLSGLKGCNSDYAKDKSAKTSTAVMVISKHESRTANSTIYLLNYRVGDAEGELSVTEETYKSVRPGQTVNFTLSKSDYEGYGWTTLFCILLIIGIIVTLISLVYVVISIIRRYF